jgi:UDP-glucose 4-epimerase
MELARQVISAIGSNSVIQQISYQKAYAPGFEDMRRRKPSVEKLRAATGFAPATTLSEIIRLTAGLQNDAP